MTRETNDETLAGNAAAMREVLQDVLFMAEKYAANSPATSAVIFDRDTGKVAREIDYLQAIEKARAALGAPARNCDRFTDEVDAQLAFLNEVWLISVTRETRLERDKFDNWTCEMRAEYAKWLMAKAEGKEAQP